MSTPGPVKPIIRVKGEEEAIRVANDSDYGLSLAVFSRDMQKAMAVANRIEAGICPVNGPTVGDEPQMPFGGVKASGYGRFGGMAGVTEFTDLRWLTSKTRTSTTRSDWKGRPTGAALFRFSAQFCNETLQKGGYFGGGLDRGDMAGRGQDMQLGPLDRGRQRADQFGR